MRDLKWNALPSRWDGATRLTDTTLWVLAVFTHNVQRVRVGGSFFFFKMDGRLRAKWRSSLGWKKKSESTKEVRFCFVFVFCLAPSVKSLSLKRRRVEN